MLKINAMSPEVIDLMNFLCNNIINDQKFVKYIQ